MRALLALGFGVLVGTVPAAGHHSFAAFYFEDQLVSIEGDVASFEYVSPHAWVHVLVRDHAGRLQKIDAEWANPARLSRQGVAADTVKPGDRVIITGSPSRNAARNRIHLKSIERPADGWQWTGRSERR